MVLYPLSEVPGIQSRAKLNSLGNSEREIQDPIGDPLCHFLFEILAHQLFGSVRLRVEKILKYQDKSEAENFFSPYFKSSHFTKNI